jgi:hypothetical protein
VDLLVAAGTLWCMFALVLFLPLVGAPAPLRHAAATLLVLQFVSLLASGYGAASAWMLATRDLPLLALALIATAIWYGLRAHRAVTIDARSARGGARAPPPRHSGDV